MRLRIYRHLAARGIACAVVAPSLTSRRLSEQPARRAQAGPLVAGGRVARDPGA